MDPNPDNDQPGAAPAPQPQHNPLPDNLPPQSFAPPAPQAPLPPQPSTQIVPPEPTQPIVVSGDFTPATQAGPQPQAQPQLPTGSGTWHGIGTANPAPAAPQPPNPMQPPQPPGSPMAPMGQPAMPGPGKKRFFKTKAFLLSLVAVLVICIGGAAAYFGVVVPNQPANILKKAVLNTAQQQKFAYTSDISVTSSAASGGGLSGKIDIDGSLDTVDNTSDTNLDLTVSGVSVSAEARYVDQNLYVKLGDLSTLSALANSLAPSDASQFNTLSSQLSNKWIEIDSTLLKEAGLNCAMNQNFTLSQSDINLLTNAYNKNPFSTIKSATSTSLNGVSEEKYSLNISNNELVKFVDSFSGISSVKSLESCMRTKTTTLNWKGDGKTTPVTVWVDKSTKRLSQISLSSNDSGTSGTITLNLSYNPSTVTAPSNSTPLLTVFTQVMNDFGGSTSSGSASTSLNSFLNGLSSGVSSGLSSPSTSGLLD